MSNPGLGLEALMANQQQPQPPASPLAAAQAAPQASLGAMMQPQAAPPATPEAEQSLKSSWMEALSRPDVQAGLLQFAMAAFQPPSPGQSSIGHIANSVSKGGKAINRLQETERSEAEKAEKLRLEQQRIGLEEQRVGLEGDRVGIERGRAQEDVRSNQAREGLTKEQMQATERQHQDSMKSNRAQIATQLQIAAGSRNDKILTAVFEDASQTYLAQLRDHTAQIAALAQRRADIQVSTLPSAEKQALLNALPKGPTTPPPVPPKMADMLPRVQLMLNVVDNKGILKNEGMGAAVYNDALVKLSSTNAQDQAQGAHLAKYLSAADQAKLREDVKRRQNIQAPPAAAAR